MKSRKWTLPLAAVLLVALMATGYLAIAADYGSKDDPLVTLSYINDVLAPEATAQIDAAFAAKAGELDSLIAGKMASIQSLIDQKAAEMGSAAPSDALVQAVTSAVLQQLGGAGTGASSNSWKVVQLTGGQKLTAGVGCEILLRSGTAQCAASGAPGLINLSSGTDLADGGALAANNLYIVTVQGNGVRAGGNVTLLVNGTYTVA